jgi:hypothetical protein
MVARKMPGMQTTFIQANGLRFEMLEALRLRTISFDAVKEPTLGWVEKRPARLDHDVP